MKQPPVIFVQLIHILGPLKGEIQEFAEPVISIGRHSSCHLQFPSDLTSISRKHAEIIREGNQFKLIDHSVNGTYVNGKRVKETYLKNGDVLTFAEEGGPKVSFLTQIKEGLPEVESMPPPPPAPPPREKPKVEPGRPPEVKPRAAQPLMERPEEVPIQSVKASLVIQYGPTLRSFKQLPITIGKNPQCDFKLEHPSILDHHIQIFFSQNQYWVKDLTGQRAVRINHQPISMQAPLKLNDDLSLSYNGPNFRFIGEGRLVEVAEPSGEEPGSFPDKRKKETPPERSEDKPPQKGASFFKKLFKP
ncbi:MAG: FHA domain-containing protein [Deltaproteobacteria bacterium]|nr:FHA domain-containing protein [Deltaproteobacteria bacterium]